MKKIITLLQVTFYFSSLLCQSQAGSSFKAIVPESGTSHNIQKLMQSLIGQGIVLKNYSITRTSSKDAFGFFEDNAERIGMKKGLLMTTGGISLMTAANTGFGFSGRNSKYVNGKPISESTFPELSRLLKDQPPTFDACVIELDIVPTSDTLSFNYVFGSEEYDEYVGSKFNDVFGFFISGKGITGDRNLAVLPGTDIPVSINTINDGHPENNSVQKSNPSFYVRNTDGHIAIEYDGLTRLMEIRQPVTAYETYHIKMAIADVADDALDSGVFIEGQSFISYDKSYNVLFDYNSSEVEQGYKTMLNDLAELYKSRPAKNTGKILITGHTDGDGSPEYNSALSTQRATEVYSYLKSKGISASDMQLVSKGENMPRADNYAEQGKQLNRRVELKLCGSLETYEGIKSRGLTEIKEETSSLKDNFPNPFTSSTTIRAFITKTTQEAVISVMDIKGNLIKTIYVMERGITEINFDAEGLSAGVYMATLIADSKNAGTIKLAVQQ